MPKQPVTKKGEQISSEPRHDIKKEKSLQATPSLKASDSKKKISGAGQSSSRSVDQRTQSNRGHSRSPTKSTKPGTNPRKDDCDSKVKIKQPIKTNVTHITCWRNTSCDQCIYSNVTARLLTSFGMSSNSVECCNC